MYVLLLLCFFWFFLSCSVLGLKLRDSHSTQYSTTGLHLQHCLQFCLHLGGTTKKRQRIPIKIYKGSENIIYRLRDRNGVVPGISAVYHRRGRQELEAR